MREIMFFNVRWWIDLNTPIISQRSRSEMWIQDAWLVQLCSCLPKWTQKLIFLLNLFYLMSLKSSLRSLLLPSPQEERRALKSNCYRGRTVLQLPHPSHDAMGLKKTFSLSLTWGKKCFIWASKQLHYLDLIHQVWLHLESVEELQD